MKSHRVWIEILVIATSIACALALLIATLGTAAGASDGNLTPQSANQGSREQATSGQQEVFQGMVTCSRCGAKHSATISQAADTCVRVCVHGGASFVLVDSDSTYLLDGNLDALKKLAGQRARIIGAISGKTIKVASAVSET